MFCKQIAICKRYFVNDIFAKDALFFVLEDAHEHEFVQAMARFQVRDADFETFLLAQEKDELSRYLLLVSTDAKYASLSVRDGSLPIQEQDRLNLFGADLLIVPFTGETVEELQVEFWEQLFRYPELLRSRGLEPPKIKLKNRVDYSRVSWGELSMIAGVPEALGVPSIRNASSDALFMGLFLAGVQTPNWRPDFAETLVSELILRLSDADLRGSGRYIDYKKITPFEIAARRLRAEQTLRELYSIQYEFNLGYGRKTVAKAISRLKGDHLAEAAALAFVSKSAEAAGFAEELEAAYETHHKAAREARGF
jgi:hypothetical protein